MHLELHRLCGASRKAVAALAFAVALASPCASAAPANLDANGVVEQALLRNHDLQAARAEVRAALGRLKQAGLWPNPRLELSNETDRPFANQGAYARSAGIAQEFPISGRLALAENVARVDVARALAEVNEAERKLVGDVTTAYFEIVVIDQKIELRDGLIRSVAGLEAASRNRFHAGEVSELDVNAATLELLRLKQDRTALAGERAAAIRTLAGLVGFGADEKLTLDTKSRARKLLLPSSDLVALAIERRPDLRLLTLSADRAEAEKALASASAWEDWNVSLGVKRDRLVIEGAPRQPADDALTMTLTIPIPLLNRNEGTRDAASAEKFAAQEQATALQQRIENEVAGGSERLTELLSVLQTYETQALPLARKNSELARSAYSNGQISISDVVQAERQEKDIGMSYAEAMAQYFKAKAQLDTATVAHHALMTHPVETHAPATSEN